MERRREVCEWEGWSECVCAVRLRMLISERGKEVECLRIDLQNQQNTNKFTVHAAKGASDGDQVVAIIRNALIMFD